MGNIEYLGATGRDDVGVVLVGSYVTLNAVVSLPLITVVHGIHSYMIPLKLPTSRVNGHKLFYSEPT